MEQPIVGTYARPTVAPPTVPGSAITLSLLRKSTWHRQFPCHLGCSAAHLIRPSSHIDTPLMRKAASLSRQPVPAPSQRCQYPASGGWGKLVFQRRCVKLDFPNRLSCTVAPIHHDSGHMKNSAATESFGPDQKSSPQSSCLINIIGITYTCTIACCHLYGTKHAVILSH